jgi:hypothetical protein
VVILAIIVLIIVAAARIRRKKHAAAHPCAIQPVPTPAASPTDDVVTAQPVPQTSAAEPSLTEDQPWLPGYGSGDEVHLKLTLMGDDGSRFPFDIPTRGRLVIGSSPSAGLRLDGTDLAPRHCELFRMDSCWFVADLSGGHTLLNSILVKGAARMEDNDLLELGAVKLIVRLPQPENTSNGDSATSASPPTQTFRME